MEDGDSLFSIIWKFRVRRRSGSPALTGEKRATYNQLSPETASRPWLLEAGAPNLFTAFNSSRSTTIRMNRNLTLLTALGAGLVLAPAAFAQAAPAAEAPATATSATAPAALPAKIALINFQQVVLASNEGQVVTANTQKKFSPQRDRIQKQAEEVDSLKKSMQSAPATLSDEERASRLRTIDTKEKALNRDAEDATTAYNTEWQEGLGKVAQKISVVMKKYAQSHGYTILLDVSNQNSDVMWALPSEDISQVVVDDYNKQSGVAAPPPSAPSAPRPAAHTAPKPAAHK